MAFGREGFVEPRFKRRPRFINGLPQGLFGRALCIKQNEQFSISAGMCVDGGKNRIQMLCVRAREGYEGGGRCHQMPAYDKCAPSLSPGSSPWFGLGPLRC